MSAPAKPPFRFDRSLLIRLFGARAALLHGDLLMLDRWGFVKRHMPRTGNAEAAFDVGCGTGAFSLNLARRGYRVTGLSWDERNQAVAQERAAICALPADFPIGDARQLGAMEQHKARYEYVLSLENIEHILDDRKLMRDLKACLKSGGWLVLSTPNKDYRAITGVDNGPFPTEETGWHVRRGYTAAMLRELAEGAGLVVEQIGGCSGFFSQKLTTLMRKFGRLGFLVTFPMRILPLLLDRPIARLFGYADYSLTLVAYKPRF
ncbi:methyltransferase domain-containing protein [Qipengyuania marisflavi]|uniref:Methyltransferase domain-containing protein n=1 Tax=Qipengyuania marisflavi TaxID=2486356 RepID=A0A5S3P070_9SPHN|nr:methyltransferase domain-containing protein [Qipengyuania marisflavi]TMM46215.1 methyltransferase domain-containing protein [Qipengyuania marisflavi]